MTDFGPFSPIRELGHGGMGVVYLADGPDETRVALKALRTDGVSARLLRRHKAILRREIRALTRLDHPGVVRIIASDTGPEPWYAMELLLGDSLLEWLPNWASSSTDLLRSTSWTEALPTLVDTGDLNGATTVRSALRHDEAPREDVLGLIGQMCHALAYVHGEGVVHCDLKPENVVVRAGAQPRPVLVDFGLADRQQTRVSDDDLQHSGSEAGTLGYIAPERLLRGEYDARADLYAVGCMLFEVVVGRLPFEGSAIKVAMDHVHTAPPQVLELSPDTPVPLARLIAGLLEKDPANRPGSAQTVVGVLETLGIATHGQGLRTPRPVLYRPPSVGRDDAQKRVSHLVESMTRGEYGALVVTGESGVGKSRVGAEAIRAARAAGAEVVVSTCIASLANDRGFAPLHGFAGLIEAAIDRVAELSDEAADAMLGFERTVLAPHFPTLETVGGDPAPLPRMDARRAEREMLWAVVNLTKRVFSDQPVMIVIDELQWADPLTIGAVAELLDAGIPGLGVFGALRTDVPTDAAEPLMERDDVEQFALTRLSDAHVATAIHAALGTDHVPAEFVQVARDRSAGNPFFLLEFVRGAVEAGSARLDDEGNWQFDLDAAGKASEAPTPVAVRELAQRRIAALPDAARRLCEQAAVVGRAVPVAWLHALQPDADVAAGELVARAIFEERGADTFRFVHDQSREAAYRGLTEPRRKQLHENVVTALRPQLEPAQLAAHLEAADRRPEAADAWKAAADLACERFAMAAADAYFERALGCADRPQWRLEQIDSVWLTIGKIREAVVAASLVADTTNDIEVKAHALITLGTAHYRLGDLAEAQDVLEKALEIGQKHEIPTQRARALNHLGDVFLALARSDKAREFYNAALAAWEELGEVQQLSTSYNNLALTHYNQCEYPEALEWWEKGLAAARADGDRRREGSILMNMANVYNDTGAYSRALPFYDLDIEITTELKDPAGRAFAETNKAIALMRLGRFAEAEVLLLRSLELRVRLGQKVAEGVTRINVGALYRDWGRPEQAFEEMALAVKLLQDATFPRGEAYALLGRGEAQLLLGLDGLDDVRAAAALAQSIGEGFVEARALAEIASYHVKRGEFAEATDALEQALAVAERTGNPVSVAEVLCEQSKCFRASGSVQLALDVAEAAASRALAVESVRLRVLALVELAWAQKAAGADPSQAIADARANLGAEYGERSDIVLALAALDAAS